MQVQRKEALDHRHPPGDNLGTPSLHNHALLTLYHFAPLLLRSIEYQEHWA